MLQVALNDYAATGITLHQTDWAAIELLKDTSGRYIFGDPNVLSTPRLWGLDAVATASHGLGEWMVGNFAMAATIYDRQDVEVLISSEHGNNFIEGMKSRKQPISDVWSHNRMLEICHLSNIAMRLNRELEMTVLLVEQKLPLARRVADRFYILDKGRAVASGAMDDLSDDVVRRFMTV